jgi:hypothetical protein
MGVGTAVFRTAVVQHVVCAGESELCDTDARMRG